MAKRWQNDAFYLNIVVKDDPTIIYPIVRISIGKYCEIDMIVGRRSGVRTIAIVQFASCQEQNFFCRKILDEKSFKIEFLKNFSND